MKRALLVVVVLLGLASAVAAHVGSPNVFFHGEAGPYPLRVTIRPPGAIPGIADVVIRLAPETAVETVSVRPGRWDAGLAGAPPPEPARAVAGAPGTYQGQTWLMTPGSYFIAVEVRGPRGSGEVLIPVVAASSQTLAMGPWLGGLLLVLGVSLFTSAVLLVGTAVRESTLAPGELPGPPQRRRGRLAMFFSALGLAALTYGGKTWWDTMDTKYLTTLYQPYAASAQVETVGGKRLLELRIDDETWMGRGWTPLFPDHGKLMHLFLVREPALDGFAHLHPLPVDNRRFRVPVPAALPAGSYRVYADITQENGLSQTLTAAVTLPDPPPAVAPDDSTAAALPEPDPDDSWHVSPPLGAPAAVIDGKVLAASPIDGDATLHLQVTPAPLAVDAEVELAFTVRGADGTVRPLEPYMGMLGHAAVRRDDGRVFAHLHPSGSISMAAQQLFARREQDGVVDPHAGHAGHAEHAAPTRATFPYAFPEPGRYRLWIQAQVDGSVVTGAFDLAVADESKIGEEPSLPPG